MARLAAAAAGAAPGFWRRLAELLPVFDGSLPDLLAAAGPDPAAP
ncbi:hypothetical protein OG871_35730 [Kitasatospora sp. NBC_00374]